MAQVQYELMACVDCLMFVANGDEPDTDSDGWCPERIATHLGTDSGFVCCGDSNRDMGFSWSRCECCGSSLGGSRHHLVVVR